MSASFALSRPGVVANPEQALTAIVEAYRSRDYPGDYKVTEEAGLISVLPFNTKTSSGASRMVSPLMLTSITLSDHDVPIVGEAIHRILLIIARRGPTISMGALLPQQVITHPFHGELINVTAQKAITDLLNEAETRMSWLLLYDPEFKKYVLTFYEIG